MDKPVELDEALRRGQAEGFHMPFDRGPGCGIVGLEDDDLAELCGKGEIARLSGRDLQLDGVVLDGPAFVFARELGVDLTNDAPVPSLAPFMARAYLGRHDSRSDILTLISSEPLSELLPRYAALFRPSAPALDAVLDKYHPPPEEGLNDYSGRHYVCDYGTPAMHCDDPWCSSELCWIKNNLCLIYLDGGTFFRGVTLYPFHTQLDEAGLQKVRAAAIPRYLREQP